MSRRTGQRVSVFCATSSLAGRRVSPVWLVLAAPRKRDARAITGCRAALVRIWTSANPSVRSDDLTLRFGLKRGKLLYVFKFPDHDVEREKHRNVITRARFIKRALEDEGYRLIPWHFKKAKPPTFWEEQHNPEGTMEEEDDDLYGPSEAVKKEESKEAESGDDSDGDQPMDEGLESGEEEEEESSDSVRVMPCLWSGGFRNCVLTRPRIWRSSLTSLLHRRRRLCKLIQSPSNDT